MPETEAVPAAVSVYVDKVSVPVPDVIVFPLIEAAVSAPRLLTLNKVLGLVASVIKLNKFPVRFVALTTPLKKSPDVKDEDEAVMKLAVVTVEEAVRLPVKANPLKVGEDVTAIS